MEIIEQNLIGKTPHKKSEDGIVVTDDFVAVIDGSTSKSDYRHSLFHSNGRYAMLLTARYIRRMPKTTTCDQFLRGVTQAIRRHYSSRQLERLATHPEDRLTCSAVIFSRVCREVWLVGDCHALLTPSTLLPPPSTSQKKNSTLLPPPSSNYYDNPKPYEAELAALRAEEARRLLAGGHTSEQLCRDDRARSVIIPRMLETMKQQNVTYAVIDGFPIPRQYVRVVPLDFQPWEVVLASDGYPFLLPTLTESEAALARQRADDPLNIGPRFQATKAFHPDNYSFDDRAYVRLRV